jgi:asparagine synthase (glutamine-hydrolysing)
MDFASHLEGMYALAVYDDRTEDLVLARDPVGIKPLYVAETSAGVAFASEAGALVHAGWVPAEVDERAWPAYFNRQYAGGARTLFKGIRRIEPGEVLRIRRGEIVERRVCPLPLGRAEEIPEAEALEVLDDLLTRTVESHLQSDVPYGAFLSGGIDSSAVVTKMAELVGRVRTYAIGFSSGSVHDERSSARRLARELNTEHHEVEFTDGDFWDLLPRMCATMDDLAADYAVLPTLKLAELASADVKVILSGEGGDEGFAGYRYYGHHSQGLVDRLRHGRRFRRNGQATRYGAIFRSADISAWRDGPRQDRFPTRGFTRLQTYQARDLSDWLPDDLMMKVDRCLMASGIEGRVPLLDGKLLSFAFALPDRLKISRGHHKHLLRAWLARRHPGQDPWGEKRGFTVPVGDWLELRRPAIRDYLGGHDAIRRLMVPERLSGWLAEPVGGGGKFLFNVLCYALWHDIHITAAPLPRALLGPARDELGVQFVG